MNPARSATRTDATLSGCARSSIRSIPSSSKAQRETSRTLEIAVRDLRLELAGRERELADRNASLEAIRASTSWRLTAPVRFVLGLARRGRKAA